MSDRVDVVSTIKVTDEASGPIGSIERAFTQLGQHAAAVGARMSAAFGPGLQLGNVASRMRGLGSAFLGVGHAARSLIQPLLTIAGIAGGISVAEGVSGLKEYAAEASKLGKMAPLLGTTVEKLDQLHYAASRAGMGAEDFDSAMGRANLQLQKAKVGLNKPLASLFARLKIDPKQSAVNILDQFADAIQKQKSPGVQRAMMMALFGRAGMSPELLRLFGGGSKQLEDWMAKRRELGGITTEDAAKAKQFAIAQRDLGDAMHATGEDIYKSILPSMTVLVKTFGEVFNSNRKEIVEGISAAITDLAGAITKVNWGEVVKSTAEWIRQANELIQTTIGYKGVIIGLGLVLAGPLLSAIWGVVTAFGALAAAIWANPITLAIAAVVVAIGSLAYLIYSEWPKIVANTQAAWAAIVAAFNAAVAAIQQAWAAIKAGFDTAVVAIQQAWAAIKATFDYAVNWYTQFLTVFVPTAIISAWSGLTEFFASLWKAIGDIFTQAWGWISPIIDKVSGAINTIKGYVPSFGRVAAAGAVAGMAMSDGAGMVPYTPPQLIPQAIAAGAVPGTAQPAEAKLDGNVTVNFQNAPPGTSVSTSGQVQATGNVGKSMAEPN